MAKTKWDLKIEKIQDLVNKGYTVEEIGKEFRVSKQRIYQIMTKFGITTGVRTRKNFLRDKDKKYYWLNRILSSRSVERADRLFLLESIEVPDVCPMLGIELNYSGTGREGWSREDNSPSIDRINSNLGYIINNIQIISWRANRIKNDSTPEELLKIATYMQKLTLNKLHV